MKKCKSPIEFHTFLFAECLALEKHNILMHNILFHTECNFSYSRTNPFDSSNLFIQTEGSGKDLVDRRQAYMSLGSFQ